jgi:ABC-type glycerol-3-phosphate transport system permease component
MTAAVIGGPSVRRKVRRSLSPGRAVSTALMIVSGLVTALPLYLLVDDGLRTQGEIVRSPLSLPAHPTLANLRSAWAGGDLGQPMGRAFLNSVIVTVIAVVVVTALSALAGYALGTFRFRGSGLVVQVILVMVAIPTQALIIPVFNLLGEWNLTNNYLGLVLVYVAFWMPFSVLLLRAAFREFPRELLEAGRIDRLSELGLLRRVVLPIMSGPIQGVAVINTIGIWSELLFSFLIMNKPETRTLPAAVVSFQGTYSSNYPLLYASLIIAVVPMLVFYAFLSSKIRKGVSTGALK